MHINASVPNERGHACSMLYATQSNKCLTMMRHVLEQVQKHLYSLWLLTKDDTPTFIIPNTIFGISGALAGSQLITHNSDPSSILRQLPRVLLFNWTNLLIFDLANQRLPPSITEDSLNKPWRPIPSSRLTSTQLRHCLLLAIPPILAFNHFILNTGTESALLYILTWMYNDLQGGDDGYIVRNVIIACAFACYNAGSLKVAAAAAAADSHSPSSAEITTRGYVWIAMMSAVILTTMHVQDLKDTAGDQARGRRTAPLVLGDRAARWSIAVPIPLWTACCAYFWGLGWEVAVVPLVLGVYTAMRCVGMVGKGEDRRTWEIWCLWTAGLYLMPLAS
jgi:4-hydroxybenzoate polyprenyltransferase